MPKITPEAASNEAAALCARAPVIPVIIYDDPKSARAFGQALTAGGLSVLEVTLRTPNALAVIEEMASVEGAVAGAGTLLSPKDAENAVKAGAQFGVSPGATDELLDACLELGLPLLAGATTATESMKLLARGFRVQKFFPAEAAGGAGFLKSLASPLSGVTFCPTGGISLDNAQSYLSLPNVACVGGSWVANNAAVTEANWAEVEKIAQHAATSLKRST